jgi:predicted chitinase
MAVPMARYEDLVMYVDSLNEDMTRFEIKGGWNGKEDRLENWAEARAVMLA